MKTIILGTIAAASQNVAPVAHEMVDQSIPTSLPTYGEVDFEAYDLRDTYYKISFDVTASWKHANSSWTGSTGGTEFRGAEISLMTNMDNQIKLFDNDYASNIYRSQGKSSWNTSNSSSKTWALEGRVEFDGHGEFFDNDERFSNIEVEIKGNKTGATKDYDGGVTIRNILISQVVIDPIYPDETTIKEIYNSEDDMYTLDTEDSASGVPDSEWFEDEASGENVLWRNEQLSRTIDVSGIAMNDHVWDDFYYDWNQKGWLTYINENKLLMNGNSQIRPYEFNGIYSPMNWYINDINIDDVNKTINFKLAWAYGTLDFKKMTNFEEFSLEVIILGS